MTDSVAAQTPVTEHVGNGVTTSFAYTFTILDSADMVVELDGVVQGSGFTVSGVGVLAGGAVLFSSAPASGVSVLLRRSTDLSRSTAYTYAGDLREDVVDADFNRLWHAMQERAEVEGRALRAPVGEEMANLPTASERANTAFLFGPDGAPFFGAPASGSAADVMLQYASTDGGKGASLVGVEDVAGRVAVANVESWLAALSDPVILVNAQSGVDPTGAIDSTVGIQAAIDAMAAVATGGRVVCRGTYLVDTLSLRSKVVLDGQWCSKFNFKAHSTSHNPVVRMGDVTTACSGAKLLGIEINGNAAGQTFAAEEWSPGVMIWGSDDNEVRDCKIHDVKGDCITIGYDTGRVVGSHGNRVSGCELYNASASPIRMCIAITYGNENQILNNRCSGVIDLELNASVGECKNNLVHGNTGRGQTEALTSPRTSDLTISLASLNTDERRYFGNTVSANHCHYIGLQYNKGTKLLGNTIVGSNSTQTRLLAIDGSDDTIVEGNTLNANSSVATALTDILRTRGCRVLSVCNNQISGDTASIPFHSFLNAYNSIAAVDHTFSNNQTETGYYRSGEMQRPSEWARFRIDNTTGGAISITQIAGVKCNAAISRSGTSFVVNSLAGGAGASWIFEMLRHCNATTAAATDMTHNCAYTYTASGSNRTVTVFTHAPAAGSVSLTAFSFASAGNTGTFFMDVWF